MKKIKKYIIAILLVSTTILAIGCQSNNKSNELKTTTKTQGSNVPKESSNKNNPESTPNSTSKDFDKLNKEFLPQIEKIFKENGIEIKDSEFDEGKKSSGDIYKSYIDKSKTGLGEVTQAQYMSNPSNKLWIISMAINTDKSMFGDNKFKIEDTLFYSLSKVIINNEIDYSALNKEINDIGSKEYFKNMGSISKEYGDFEINIIFTQKYMGLNINLNNENI